MTKSINANNDTLNSAAADATTELQQAGDVLQVLD